MAFPYLDKDITTQLHNKEIFDMSSEICNFCMGKTKLGIYAKRKLTSTGNRYKWTEGQSIHVIVCESNVDFEVRIISFYEDGNTYEKKDLLIETQYSIIDNSKNGVIDTNFKMFNFLKGKIRKIRISRILKTK